MNNLSWGKRLAEKYKAKTDSDRKIRLPAADQIQFEGERDRITVTMQPKAIVANLQTNAAAFEAWSLALKVWCDVDQVELRWQPPEDPRNPHYQRFLYRAERFRSLFPEWFSLGRTDLLSDAAALGSGPFSLNTPGDRSALEERQKDKAATDSARESDLEIRLFNSKQFRDHFQLDEVSQQFPVGLFLGSVNRKNRIFTGGKSAIDLIGIGDATLRLFELKAGDNIPAGILSELLFYTSVMRDALPGSDRKPARFQFNSAKPRNILCDSVMSCKRIEAVFLGEAFHPVIGHPEIIRALNGAAKSHWNTGDAHVPVSFRGFLLKGSSKTGFQFQDLGV